MSPELRSEDREPLVNEVFAKFSRSIRPEKLDRFPHVGSFLAYLKCCAWSVTIDDRRSRQNRAREEALDFLGQVGEVLDDPADTVAFHLDAEALWQLMWSEATTIEERLILQEICVRGMTPRQLQQAHPSLFPTVDDLYRIKRNILDRLRNNHQIRGRLQHARRAKA